MRSLASTFALGLLLLAQVAFAQQPAKSFTGVGVLDNDVVIDTTGTDMSLYTKCNLMSTGGAVDVFVSPIGTDTFATTALQIQDLGAASVAVVQVTAALRWYGFEIGPTRAIRVLQNGGTAATAYLSCWR
jgi:hypothetical protein